MPKFKVQATQYTFYDAVVEAKDYEEADALAYEGNVEWIEVGGDWETHETLTFREDNDWPVDRADD